MQEDHVQKWAWAKSETLSEKQNKAERLVGVADVMDHLPSKFKALSSKPSTTKKKGMMI
jgi:hypothetical protein